MTYLKSDEPLLIIIGPSGAGKSTIIKRLVEDGLLEVSPSWTTRTPRSDELIDSIEHCFVSEKEFLARKKKGFFLETAKMFDLPYYYGLPKIIRPARGHIPVIMIRAKLLPLADKHFKNYKVYHIEDTKKRIESRLKERLKKGEEMGSRLNDYEKEIELGRKMSDRVFVNTKIETLFKQIKQCLIQDFGIK